MTSISIVTSALNEEKCIPELLARIEGVAKLESNYEFSIVIVDNGSQDNTGKVLENYLSAPSSLPLTVIKMSRTFAFDAALSCGLEHCISDLAVIMTSDLQDPPEEISRMLRKFEEGFEQVVVRITSRESVPLFRRILTSKFYQLANRLTSGVIMDSVSDFRLVTRNVYLAMRSLQENHRFIRGIGSWVGFKTISIDMARPERFGGESKWLQMKMGSVIFRSLASIFAFSSTPLLFIASFGIWTSFSSLLLTFIMAVSWISFGVPFAGFGTIIGIILVGFSIILNFLGVLAQYIALIYEEVKRRPSYIVKEIMTRKN